MSRVMVKYDPNEGMFVHTPQWTHMSTGGLEYCQKHVLSSYINRPTMFTEYFRSSQCRLWTLTFLGRRRMSEIPKWPKRCCRPTVFISVLSRRGRPSNVFRRFGRRRSFNNWPRNIAHPPLNFTGVKKCELLRHFRHHSTLSRPC